jgi:hypothetical protein
VPYFKGFQAYHSLTLDINTTVSTWLDCSILMSRIRQIAPFVRGNLSTALLTAKSRFSRPRSFSETGQCACSYYIMQTHRFPNRLKTSL